MPKDPNIEVTKFGNFIDALDRENPAIRSWLDIIKGDTDPTVWEQMAILPVNRMTVEMLSRSVASVVGEALGFSDDPEHRAEIREGHAALLGDIAAKAAEAGVIMEPAGVNQLLTFTDWAVGLGIVEVRLQD